jgi:pilus assembly protein CpaB
VRARSAPRALRLPDLRRALHRRRGLVAGGLAAAAVAVGLGVIAPEQAPSAVVMAAARDLPGGAALEPGDLRAVELPVEVVPDGVLRSAEEATGRVLAGRVRSGEPLTDARLLGSSLVPAGGSVAVPVRVAEPALGLLVGVGDRVDVLAAAPDGDGTARAVVSDVPVLAVPTTPDTADGALLVVAAPPSAAATLAAAAVTSRLSVVVRGR